jgi:transposase
VPDHSSLSRIRTRLAGVVYDEVFRFVLSIVEKEGLLEGRVVGVDSTYLRADASMRAIVRRDTGERYAEYLKTLARAEGIENPTDEDGRRLDRKRKKKTSNREWKSATDPDAKIARLKDGRTKLAYKPEHVVDLETGAILAAEVHPGNAGDTKTIGETLESARANVSAALEISEISNRDDDDSDGPPTRGPSSLSSADGRPGEVVADKGYHSARVLLDLEAEGFRPYIPEPKRKKKRRRWADKGGRPTAQAVYRNRQRCGRRKSKALHRRRGELVERPFAHVCETGGARRTRLRGRENVAKRYKVHVAASNLGLVMRHLLGVGTPRELWDAMRRAAAAASLLGVAWMAVGLATVLIAAGAAISTQLARWYLRLRALMRSREPAALRIAVCSTGC